MKQPIPLRLAEQTAEAIDREVKSIVKPPIKQALDILEHNRDLLETIANQLLETEVIEGEELHNLLSQVKSGTQVHPEVSLAEAKA